MIGVFLAEYPRAVLEQLRHRLGHEVLRSKVAFHDASVLAIESVSFLLIFLERRQPLLR